MAADDIFIAKYGSRTFGIQTHYEGNLMDADGPVTFDVVTLDGATTVFTGRVATNVDTGLYVAQIASEDTAVPNQYRLVAHWVMDSVATTAEMDFTVGEASPDYESLAPDTQAIVGQVWARLADLFDAPYGGPHLQVYRRFTRNRIAQLMRVAVGTLNTAAQPFQTYSLDPGGQAFPTAMWGPLLERATWIEVLKHLRRSYVEQPMADGVSTARLDRRDYLQRWGEILQDETETFEDQMESFKMASMGLSGAARILVAGGAYGINGAEAPMSLPARPHYWLRSYT